MILDGIFIHHLVKELNNEVCNKRINKIALLDNYSFLLYIQGKKIYFSLNPDICHIRFTNLEYLTSNKTFPFYISLKKHLEGSIIRSFSQIENDRIVQIEIEAADELGYKYKVYLIMEFFGRNANSFLLNNEYIIIDCLKKSFVLEDNNKRILIPKQKYCNKLTNKINPFNTNIILNINNYQGVSNLNYSEIIYRNDLSFIHKPIPQLISNHKTYFSCFTLLHLDLKTTIFPTLSDTLEEYYQHQTNLNIYNYEQKLLDSYIKHEIIKTTKKLEKQKLELAKANDNLYLQNIGNLLSANLYQVQKNTSKIIVKDFYNNNIERTIELNPSLSPAKNLESIFNRYKKAKRAVGLIFEQMESSKDELQYLSTLEDQFKLAKQNDLKEIIEELKLIKVPSSPKKKQKPHIEEFQDKNGNFIWVGKNNLQNNYLTHIFAQNTDYFFHVRGVPGSHTILRTKELNEDAINLSANIAAYYSKSQNLNNVAVDYTILKYVKKVPKQKGSFVIYSNHKTVYVTPSLDFIKKNTI